jgi:hypothetical protein
MKVLPVLCLALICIGCEEFQTQQKSQQMAGPANANAHSHFEMYPSSGETFLLDKDTGKVWRYEVKDRAFLEIPVTSKIVRYDANGNRVEPDPKDPLGLFDSKPEGFAASSKAEQEKKKQK